MIILGISGLYHDSAAAIISGSEILAAAQEERFTRIKHDNSLPVHAIDYCLDFADITMDEVDAVVYYDNPWLTLDRYIHNIMAAGEEAKYLIDSQFDKVVVARLGIEKSLRKHYGVLGKNNELLVCEHHISHAASAFYPSPYESAAIITIDGVGEWATTTIGRGDKEKIEIIKEIDYPHSIGLFYSAFTAFCGFKVNSGDYKFMGLAPYGDPIYYQLIKEKIIDIKDDGSFRLNLDYFSFYKDKYMTNKKFAELFGGPARMAESKITIREMNIAASVQKVVEELLELLARYAREITGEKNLVLAGGVAFNCVANGKLLKKKIFDNIWIQPAAGDAGGALGCALYVLFNKYHVVRKSNGKDWQKGSFLGPSFSTNEIEEFLIAKNYKYWKYEDKDKLYKDIARKIKEQKVIGWFQGRMEYGPRALGHRSIIADATNEKMQSILNLKIKYRESFRPFAPVVKAEDCSDYFEMETESPYMLFVANIKKSRRIEFDKNSFLTQYEEDMLPIVNVKRSDIPAVTHIDYSARVQTVKKDDNYELYQLLTEYKKLSGYSVLINTSFNVRGEPIVCTPQDAYKCFMRTDMDILVLEDCVLYKSEQPLFEEPRNWRLDYELD